MAGLSHSGLIVSIRPKAITQINFKSNVEFVECVPQDMRIDDQPRVPDHLLKPMYKAETVSTVL